MALGALLGMPRTAGAQAPKAAPAPEEKKLAPGGKYFVHDMARPRPRVVEPGAPGQPPSDAIVLFDG
jgi:hypothetical protein